MEFNETLIQLEKMGTAQNRKIYARHGVNGEQFGVSFAHLGKLQKKIKTNHPLARQLWQTGNHDARILATMIADPGAVKSNELDVWVKDLDNYVICDLFSKYVSGSAFSLKKMQKWSKSTNEWIGRTGWLLLTHMAMAKNDLPNDFFYPYIMTIETDIHKRKNRVRDAMNSALIAIGIRNTALRKKAVKAAKLIGKVDVDHGETSCKTPDAVAYINKAVNRKKKSN